MSLDEANRAKSIEYSWKSGGQRAFIFTYHYIYIYMYTYFIQKDALTAVCDDYLLMFGLKLALDSLFYGFKGEVREKKHFC